jgi:hypothetical protein
MKHNQLFWAAATSERQMTHLVVVAVCAGPDLDALVKFVGTTKHIRAHFTGCLWTRVVKAYNEQGFVEHVEAHRVARILSQSISVTGPDRTSLGRQHT